MFYSLFPIILIFVSLAGLAALAARKFPQLAVLDPEKLPEVKQAKVKEDIQFQKFIRVLDVFGARLKKIFGRLSFLRNGWLAVQRRFRLVVHQWQERYKKSVLAEIQTAIRESKRRAVKIRAPKAGKKPAAGDNLLKQGEEALERKDFSLAERCFIEAVKADPKEIEAYRGLGKVYLEMKKDKEAKETFEFLIKLKPDDDRSYNRLGMIEKGRGKLAEAARFLEEAVKLNNRMAVRFYDLGQIYAEMRKPAAALRHFAKAAEIEPNNPKYLDSLLEMSIITGDVDLAVETYNRLRLVNPENQKLLELKRKIEEMEE